MAISLILFAASAWMWHVGERVAAGRRANANRAAAMLPPGARPAAAAASPAAAKSAPAKVAAKKTSSYVLSNTPQTLKQLLRNDRALILRNAHIDTTRGTKLDIPEHLRSEAAPGSYIVQSRRAPDAGFYAELSKDGAEFVSYIPNNAALVSASPDAGKIMSADPLFAAVLPYEPYYKLDDSLLPEAVAQTLMTNNVLRVTVFQGQTAAATQSLAALGANVMGEDQSPFGTTLIALVPPDKLAAVAQMPQAQEIETYSPRHLMNDLTRTRLGVSTTPSAAANYLNLTGTNIWVNVNDSGADSSHPDLASRLLFDTNGPTFLDILDMDTNGHGTHVVGTIGGDGTASATVTSNIPGSGVPKANQFRGMAPQARFFVQAVDTLTGPYISDFYLQTNASYTLMTKTAGSTAGVTNGFISNDSWGYADTSYDIMAASYDAATRDSQPNFPGEQSMLYVFAAGDSFQAQNSITSPGTAKNVITVGAIQNPRYLTNLISVPNEFTNYMFWEGDTDGSNSVAALTSAGNVDVGTEGPGGRFKPDVVAPGVWVVSARSAKYEDQSQLETTYYYNFPGQTLPPGQMQVYAMIIPTNTTNLIIQASPNPSSPIPFPTDLLFYYNFTNNNVNLFPPGTQITRSNEAGLALEIDPTGTNCYIGVNDSAADPHPVAYDLHVWAITETQYGNYFSTLSNLNNAFGATKPYRYESGTSMSAAAVSGMLADMQEFLTSNMNIMPSPALLKALLINGARPLNDSSDLNPQQLGTLEGWGLPNLPNSVPASLTTNASSMALFDQTQTNGLPNALQTGQWHNYMVTMDPGATNFPLRVTLVWTDPPGNPAAGIALVNNLDLMVADNTGTNLFIGNDFPVGGGEAGVYTQPSPTNTSDPSDLVNNVECVYLDSAGGLQQTYYISVRGTRVAVNAVSTQTNAILQDYALVISSDDQTPATGLTVTNLGISSVPLTNFAIVSSWTNTNAIPPMQISYVTNATGQGYLHQRVGGNEPNLWGTNVVTNLLGVVNVGTNGNPLQWHFFVLTNTVTGTNPLYTNAIFATFLPPSLTFNSAPANMSLPANQDADIDLYVSTNYGMTNLDAATVANSLKSLGRGGNKTVIFSNAAPMEVYYAGVKSETQQGADFGFYAAITTNLDDVNSDGSVSANGIGLPVVIPDESPGGQGVQVLAIVIDPTATSARKVAVLLGLEHSNPADLYGTMMAGETQATLNNYTAYETPGFTNWYDDLPDGSITPTPPIYLIPTDPPGNLKSFVGQPMNQTFILNETDNALLQTGMVTTLQVRAWPQPLNPLDFFIPYIAPHGWYFGYVDVPDDATNLNIAVSYYDTESQGPVGIYIDNQDDVNPGDFGVANISKSTPTTNIYEIPLNSYFPVNGFLSFPPPSAYPQAPTGTEPYLTGGRWYYGITNQSAAPVTNLEVLISIWESQTPNLTLTKVNTNATALQTDAHTQSQICINDGILTNDQTLVSVQLGIRLVDTNLDDLVIHLISPQGTSVTIFENRGGTNAISLGLTVTNAGGTNGSYDYTTFTENTNLTATLIKFANPPYAQPTSNATFYLSSFETVTNGDYGPSNTLFPVTLGTNLEIWTVTTNDVAVVNTSNILYRAYDGTNYLALANGELAALIPTVVGQAYSMTYAYRGPGLLDWWPFEGDAEDLIGTNNGIITGSGSPAATFTSGIAVIPGIVGEGFQFDGIISEINFGTNAGIFGTNDFTIDYWINTTNTGTNEQVFLEKRASCQNNESGWGIIMPAAVEAVGDVIGTAKLYVTDPGGTNIQLATTNVLNDGQWHHLAWERTTSNSSSTYLLYVDGQLNNTTNYPGGAVNLTNANALLMGQSVCPAFQPFSGAADEMDFWNRALTDVEIAAIYEAGTNHIGKATTASILPNCEILTSPTTNWMTNYAQIGAANWGWVTNYTQIATNVGGTNWITNGIYFTALSDFTTVVLRGNPLGMLFDDFKLNGPTNLNYVLPEESLASFTGENPVGCWTLDVWDTRTDSPLPTNGVLLGWNLQMTISATNVNLIVLTNHIPYTNGLAQSNSIEYFAFDVPINANFATNTMTNANTNLTLLFNQVALPTGSQLGDYALIADTNRGVYVLTNGAPPPTLVPGRRYFLGVENNTETNASFTLEVDTDRNNLVITPLTNAIPLTTNILVSSNAGPYTTNLFATNAPEYYSFVVPTNAILASFEIINPTNQIDLYVRHTAPLPSSTSYDYATSYDGTNDEAIVVTTNSYLLTGAGPDTNDVEGTNSMPVPLTPGTWYLAVYDYSQTNTTNLITYTIEATYVTNSVVNGVTNNAITIIPLTNQVASGAYQTNGTSPPGPALTNFYSFTITNDAPGVQFVVTNMTENVDLIVRDGFLPTPQQMTAGSFNPGTNSQVITIVTNASMPSLTNGVWYLGVPNNGPTNVNATFTISAVILTNITNIYNSPAVTFSSAVITTPAKGFTMNWYSVAGGQYEVDMTSNLTSWSYVTNVTTTGGTGAYTDPTPIHTQAARFYRVFKTN
jgi:subtilisin-like proprotein convertase family protein